MASLIHMKCYESPSNFLLIIFSWSFFTESVILTVINGSGNDQRRNYNLGIEFFYEIYMMLCLNRVLVLLKKRMVVSDTLKE